MLCQTDALNAAADFGLKDTTLETNITFKLSDRFSVSADAMQLNNQSLFSVEGSYQLGHGLSVAARTEYVNGTAFSLTETAPDSLFGRVQIEQGKTSFEAGINIKV
jgi:predicted porin